MSIFNSMNISATGLTAEKTRIDIISKNMANMNTTKTSGGAPYRRQIPVFKEDRGLSFIAIMEKKSGGHQPGGVKVSEIVEDQTDFKRRYEPGHPDSDEDGYVEYPNVEPIYEMVDLISAQRGYDANVTAVNASKSMLMKALDIGRR